MKSADSGDLYLPGLRKVLSAHSPQPSAPAMAMQGVGEGGRREREEPVEKLLKDI